MNVKSDRERAQDWIDHKLQWPRHKNADGKLDAWTLEQCVEMEASLTALLAEVREEERERTRDLLVLIRQMKNWMGDLQRYINGDPKLPRVFLATSEEMAEQTKVLTHKALDAIRKGEA